jgi:hypothetical protein
MFAQMGLMYSWATKEYLLWEMSIDQIVLYLNKGIEIQYGIEPGKAQLTKNRLDDLKKIKEEMKEKEKLEKDNKEKEALMKREELKRKYGEI